MKRFLQCYLTKLTHAADADVEQVRSRLGQLIQTRTPDDLPGSLSQVRPTEAAHRRRRAGLTRAATWALRPELAGPGPGLRAAGDSEAAGLLSRQEEPVTPQPSLSDAGLRIERHCQ